MEFEVATKLSWPRVRVLASNVSQDECEKPHLILILQTACIQKNS